MVLVRTMDFKELPGGTDFLNDVVKRYDQSVADDILNSGLKLQTSLNPLPILSFSHTDFYGNLYDYKLSAKGVWKSSLRNLNLGKIVGLEANNVALNAVDYPNENYNPNNYLDYFLIGIHCDYKKINPRTYKNGQKDGLLWLWIEYAGLSTFDF